MSWDPTATVPVALAVRLAVIVATLVVAGKRDVARRVAFIGSVAASLVTLVGAVLVLASGASVRGVLFVQQASGFSLGYRVDGLSAWFLVVLSTLAIPIAVFSVGYIGHRHWRARSVFIGIAFNILLGAVELVFAADDAITFLLAWEAMTLATAALVVTEHELPVNRRAAFLYLVMSHVGTGCLFAGFLGLAALSGASSLSFTTLLTGAVGPGFGRDMLFVLFLVGFGVKAGLVPLHVWLPEAHPAAPTNVSALMSGVLIKTGIYGLVRVAAFGLGSPSVLWGVIIIVCGGVAALLGVLYALMQHDLKRLLAYHSIENIGIILLGLGAGMVSSAYGRYDVAAIGIAASLFHVLNHAVFKGLLFLGAGGVVMAAATRRIEELGGLLRRMPWTGFFFLIGAMAISGLPPFNGFASEWLTFQAFLFGFQGSTEPLVHFLFPAGGALLALTTALAAACFVKAFGVSFLALPRSPAAAHSTESPAIMLVPQAFLATLCLGLGVFPGAVLRVLAGVVASLPGLAHQTLADPGAAAMSAGSFDRVMPVLGAVALVVAFAVAGALTLRRRRSVRVVPTWGCGGELTARTEYTATAFSKPIMMIFRGLYRPTRQVEAMASVSPYFPQGVRYQSEIEPTFERYVYGPLLRGVLRLAGAMKVLQAGSLHAYLAYVIALVLILMLAVWWRG